MLIDKDDADDEQRGEMTQRRTVRALVHRSREMSLEISLT
jgi:hypothetical protein